MSTEKIGPASEKGIRIRTGLRAGLTPAAPSPLPIPYPNV